MGLISKIYGGSIFSRQPHGNSKKRKKKHNKSYWMNRAWRAEAELERTERQVKKQAGPSFYESDSWRLLRYQALKRHGAKCQLCGATKQDGAILQVDHIKPRSKYPNLALSLDNLQVLCRPCNLGKGAWDESDWRTKTLSGS